MKKLVIILALVFASIAMGSAYALWTDSVTLIASAESAFCDVQITGRTTYASPSNLTHSPAGTPSSSNPYDSIDEEFDYLITGNSSYEDQYLVSYELTNTGTAPVLIDSITYGTPALSADSEDLYVSWFILLGYVDLDEIYNSMLISATLDINGTSIDINDITLRGSSSVNFNSSLAVLNPNESCTLWVQYHRDKIKNANRKTWGYRYNLNTDIYAGADIDQIEIDYSWGN